MVGQAYGHSKAPSTRLNVQPLILREIMNPVKTTMGPTISRAECLSATGRHLLDRREFFSRTATGLGGVALTALLNQLDLQAGQQVINYCGGGIAATTTAFVLETLGFTNWSVYDNSMNEWANTPDKALQTGE